MKKTFILLLIGTCAFSQNQTDKDFYFSANVNPSSNKTVYSISQQYDNKIIVGLTSTALYDANQYIKRLNIDGTTDNSFSPPNMIVRTDKIVIQNDNKILIGTTGNGTGSVGKNIARLNPDGSLDQQFTNNLNYLTGNGGYNGVALQTDNKILVAGNFTTVDNINIKGLIRLNPNGLRDTSFNLTGNGFAPLSTISTYEILPLNNGKILIWGYFTSYNNISYNGLVRLNSDGSLDTTFNIGSGFQNSWVSGIGIQSNGKIIVGGGFESFNGNTAKKYLVRLNTDGTIDNTFFPSNLLSNSIKKIIVLPDDNILIAGIFPKKLVKLNANGTNDTTFDVGTGFDNTIFGLYKQTDNQFLIGGAFSQYQSTTSNMLVRLLGNSVLSNENFEIEKNIIYPNPARELIYISNISNVEYEIFDMLGESILKSISNGNQINVNSITKGIYILSLKNDNKIINQKFIKE